ncbi:hypothetical protein GT755_27390 [Herbidospora sp. NEAU-GS84]|uniref:Uncharacterized protein n=1 Tax=Herbidospora solisilvae TaxID=2696284 RepID=A0A7C9NHP0_9ACTN|nr:hypothetical protein [Herbidospora solisilvae]NAS25395.1 hypothetical protein [Herbidospora solisilvae]
MNQQEPPRDWFSPPPSQPTEIDDTTYSGPLPPMIPAYIPPLAPPSDVLVWPPPPPPPTPEEDDEGFSTQPFPAIAAGRPLPRPQPSFQDPEPYPPFPDPPPVSEQPPPPPPEPEPKKKGWGRFFAGAAGSVVLAVGAPAAANWSTYVYATGEPDTVHVVPAGESYEFEHVAWRSTIEPIPNPAGAAEKPGRQWVKIMLTRTALDRDGTFLTGVPDVEIRDGSGRKWRTEVLENATPLDPSDDQIGRAFPIEIYAVVPTDVAGTAELFVRPKSYRSDTPTEDLTDDLSADLDVLRFLR